MTIQKEVLMIEFYGETLRYGVEGKWVEWIYWATLFDDRHKPTRKEVRKIIEDRDREKTQ